MLFKSFEVENNIEKILKFKFILLYGENIGLKEVLKKKIINSNNNADIINLYQEDLAKNKNVLSTEVKNVSLFVQKKIIFINQINEKLYFEIESLLNSKENVVITLIGDLLDKKSKLRNLFEKETNMVVVPCYNDNDITLKKLVQSELKDFKNLNSNALNMILSYSNSNRKTILSNIEKIKSFFDKKELSEESLEILLNSDRNEMFENIRDAALDGNKTKLNHLLSNFAFSNEESFLYLNIINYRLIKLLDIHKQNVQNNDFNVTISKMRPPIFWKDKPVFHRLLKKWDLSSVLSALRYLGQTEEKLRKNSNLNNLTIIKNSITNICTNSWSYF